MGCLFVFGRMVAQTCFNLGAMVATILIRGVSFVLISVVGPLWLGSVREFVVRALRITHHGKPLQSSWQIGNRAVYAGLSGLVWVAGAFLLRALWGLLGWAGAAFTERLAPNLASWLPLTLLALLIFVIGSVVGAQVHRRDHGIVAGW